MYSATTTIENTKNYITVRIPKPIENETVTIIHQFQLMYRF